ncbi:MAG: type VI secretion system contractile sheath small subunit [Candidatus Adiutrix sp.]|jgi:type VI secretion system protein ImpB|nr:type VI secretion system contractile sheath small subunit [Candidatus Adiutrix sp.]
MVKEGSVAPKERVNIVYKPATGDAKAEVELPNKILVLGDFTQKTDDRLIEDRDPVSVDKDNFNDVLKAQNITLDLAVPDELSGTDDQDAKLAVHLEFSGMKDFEPDSVASAVPELAKLLEVREALKALKGPLSNVPDFRKKLQDIVKDEAARDKLLEALNLKKE